MTVTFYYNKITLFEADTIFLEPYAIGTSRCFKFFGIRSLTDSTLEQIENDIVQINSPAQIKITIVGRSQAHILINDFKIYVKDIGQLSKNSLSVAGLVFDDKFNEYEQSVIDIFYMWHLNVKNAWAALCKNDLQKRNYFHCCFLYSGLAKKIVEREVYKIDMALIHNFFDHIYTFSEEFMGERGYLGHSHHTFFDCLLEVFHNKGFEKHRSILFFNIKEVNDPAVADLFIEIKNQLGRYNFSIEEHLGMIPN